MSPETNSDLRIDYYRAPANALVLKGSATVVVTHIPTGLKGWGMDAGQPIGMLGRHAGRYEVALSAAMAELKQHLDWHYGPLVDPTPERVWV